MYASAPFLHLLDGQPRGLDIDVPAHYFPHDDPSQSPVVTWRSSGQLLYTNWLNYYVYQTTPYDLRKISEEAI